MGSETGMATHKENLAQQVTTKGTKLYPAEEPTQNTHISYPTGGLWSQGIYPSVPVSYWLPDALSITDPLVLLLACNALRQRGRCWQLQVSQMYMMEGSRNYG